MGATCFAATVSRRGYGMREQEKKGARIVSDTIHEFLLDDYTLAERCVIAVMDELDSRKGIFSDIDEDVMQEIHEACLSKIKEVLLDARKENDG